MCTAQGLAPARSGCSEGVLGSCSTTVRPRAPNMLTSNRNEIWRARRLQPEGLSREGWKSTQPILDISRRAFAAAGLPYYNPHSLRKMLVRHAMLLDLTPAGMKAWPQNLGHKDVLATFTSCGVLPVHQQGELIGAVKHSGDDGMLTTEQVAALRSILAQQPSSTAL